MKVLVIPTWYPSGEDKLMGQYHKDFTHGLNKYGVDADMLFIDRQRLSKPLKYLFMKKKSIDKEIDYDVYIYRMLNLNKFGFDFQLNRYVKKLDGAFKDYLKTHEKPDVIHAHVTVPAGYAACKLGKKYDIPIVVTEHCGDLERFYKREDLKEYGHYVLNNSCYSTVSKYMKDIVLKYTDECLVIPNIVDTEIFKNDVKREIKGTFRLVSVCALREGKRLDIAFKAIKNLIDEGMDIHFDIIGDGFYEKIYKEQVADLNLEKHVTFLGRMDKERISDAFIGEHALLISSELESFGIPGVEALAAGLPVITTDCLGPTEYVDESVGVICKVNDVTSLEEAIKDMIGDYSKYKRKDLEKRAQNYSEKKVILDTIKIYEEVIKKHKK